MYSQRYEMFIFHAIKPLTLILSGGDIPELPFRFEKCKKSSYLHLTPAPLSTMERGRGRGKISSYESFKIWRNFCRFP